MRIQRVSVLALAALVALAGQMAHAVDISVELVGTTGCNKGRSPIS